MRQRPEYDRPRKRRKFGNEKDSIKWSVTEIGRPNNTTIIYELKHTVINQIYALDCQYSKTVDVTYTRSSATVDEWIKEEILTKNNKNPTFIGFDVESRPNYVKGKQSQINLMQFGYQPNDQGNYKILLYHNRNNYGISQTLHDLLTSHKYIKCGIGLLQDCR
eukprot:UN34491